MQGLSLALYHEAVWKNQDIPHVSSQAILLRDIFYCVAASVCLPASLFALAFPKNQHVLSWRYRLCVYRLLSDNTQNALKASGC